MTLTSGTKLGPYEIVSPLGAGGMGEVYRARDTRLDRTVAVKVLPQHLADTPEARERFDREARAVSSLNHAHICTLHDVGHQGSTDYLVMEYLEGETLGKRIERGPLPAAELLRIAIEIADALEKAHRQGILHRDLKPGNIMLTKAGAKLMDFGLAKATPTAVDLSSSPTISQPLPTDPQREPLTAKGTIVGTFQYMAPEQIEGKETDARSDIFSFGAVLYEMATGKKAFEGKSQASLIAAILEREPPAISTLQPMSPPALDRVVKTCLAKDPDERFQTAHDLKLQLQWIAESGSQVTLLPTAAKGIGARWRGALLWGVVSLLLAAITGLAIWNLKPSLPPRPVTRTVITLPPGQRLAGLEQPALAISPDGNYLAYVAIQAGTQQLYLRAMDNLEAKPVPGTEGATGPFFSPDGQWLGFVADGKLKKVSVSGGAALTLGDVAQPRGASWSSQGSIAFAPTAVSAFQQVSDAGGASQPLTRLAKGENSHRWPEFLPGGKAVLFSAALTSSSWVNAQVAVHSVVTGERRNLVQPGTQPRFASSGHLVYSQAGTLMAVPFDPQGLSVTGTGVPVVEGVLQSTLSGAAQYSLSATGSLVYATGGIQGAQRSLVWVTRNGAEQPVTAPARAYRIPRLSPDGRRVVVAIDEQETQLWLYDLFRETLTRLTFEGKVNQGPVWAPDGKRIAFQSNKEGPPNLFLQLADGSGGLEQLTNSESAPSPNSWSSDGQLLAFIDVHPTTGFDIWVLHLSDRKAQPFLRTPFIVSAPRFSPDGRWLAYISNESGRYEIYVQPYPGPGGKWQISTEGGTEPMWNPNGREMFYRSGRKMLAVEIATQPGFAAGRPRVLFEGDYLPTPLSFPNYDVSPDGQRFLMLKSNEAGEAAPTQINVVLNWFEELKRRVPPGKK
jgi:eukaryotic-like serine/threonine-protein kinase